MPMKAKFIPLAAAAIAVLAVSFPASAEVVGTMTALQTKISGTNGKNLAVGAQISLGDKLRSNKTGLGMIVFVDESSAKIGPNSDLVIDEFVYQPGRNKGAVAIKMKSGLTRFYGGQVSKTGKMEVTTPHIVLGIRGGILDTLVTRTFTKAVLRAGRMFCTVNGQRRVVTKPGFACISNGSTLRIELANDDDMATLDSRDRIAGTGVPGQLGPGLKTRAVCLTGDNDANDLCKSSNASLPGLNNRTGRRHRIQPLGSQEHEYPVEPYTTPTTQTPTVAPVTTTPTVSAIQVEPTTTISPYPTTTISPYPTTTITLPTTP